MMTQLHDNVQELLRSLRKIESEKTNSMTDTELARAYSLLSLVSKDLESFKEVMKEDLVKRNIQDQPFPDLKNKVVLSEGKATSSFDNLSIAKKIGIVEFCKISSVVEGKITDKDVKSVVDKFKTTTKGKPYISVLKLSGKDILKG